MTCKSPFPRLAPKAGCFSVAALGLAAALSAAPAGAAQQGGRVQSGFQPVAYSEVSLYRAGTGGGSEPALLGTARADASGRFLIEYTPPSDPQALIYLIARGGVAGGTRAANGAIGLATVPGAVSGPTNVVINERTTVATAWAFARFLDKGRISGPAPGPKNAAATLRNLVDPRTGAVGAVLASPPNGDETQTLRQFNSLANLLAACVQRTRANACKALFRLSTPPGGPAPADTLQAAVNVARHPARAAGGLFRLSRLASPYLPALAAAPDAWTLALIYEGNGKEFDGPGNIAFDKDGNAWIPNNYTYSPDPRGQVCGDNHLLRLDPAGRDFPGAPYKGGGLYGAGFGIGFDPDGNVWVANFGFQGSTCQKKQRDVSVSKFSGKGVALSPPVKGFQQGDIKRPQGLASDQAGNIWIANCGNDSVTVYRGGDPAQAENFGAVGLKKPFGLAVDGDGSIWVASNNNNRVVKLAGDGSVLARTPPRSGIKKPMGIAIDSLGNAWVSNSGRMDPPCYTQSTHWNIPSRSAASVTQIAPDGSVVAPPYKGGGMFLPWGIAVDGDDNVWVANFGGQRLTQLCGARPQNCPAGLKTGDPISPRSGYTFDALTRNTGVQIDPSGNVWLANNWMNKPLPTNPGGHSMAVFIGLAAPVKAPLIGPPQRP